MPMITAKSLSERAEEVYNEIINWNKDIAEQYELEKYKKMLVNPYAFYRGTNHLFWKDFSVDERMNLFGNSVTHTWVMGDAHVYNYGAFYIQRAGVIYGLNDFDDAVIADYQFDLWRMAVSIVLVARENQVFSLEDQAALVNVFSESYLDELLHDSDLETYYNAENTYGKLSKFLKKTEEKKSRNKMLEKWTVMKDGRRVFNTDSPKLGSASYEEKEFIMDSMAAYRETLEQEFASHDEDFQVKDVAKRLLAGTGSLGTNRYYILIEGYTEHHEGDHILDIKFQGAPTPYDFLPEQDRKVYDRSFANHAQRHASAYTALARYPDDYLGWMRLSDGYYSVKERSPFKDSFPAEKLIKFKRFRKIAEQWGRLLAICHNRAESSPYVIKHEDSHFLQHQVADLTDGKHGDFHKTVADVALGYADQVERDFKAFEQRVHVKL